MQSFKERQFDLRYFDMTKSRWFIKDQILDLLQNRKKAEMSFARNLSLEKPCLLKNFTPRKLLKLIKDYSKLKCSLLMYSPVCLKTSFLFRNNKCIDDAWNNYIVYTPYNEELEKKRKDQEEKYKKDLEDILEKGREKRRKELQEKQEKLEKERKEREEKEALFKKVNEEHKEGQGEGEGQEKHEEQGEEEKKEGEEEKKEGEEKKKEGEEEKKEGEEEKKEGEEEKKEGEEEKKEGEEEKKEEQKDGEKIATDRNDGTSPRQLNSDRTSNVMPTSSVIDKQQSQNQEFKNLVLDKEYIQFHFLNKEDEVNQFLKSPEDYYNFIFRVRNDIKPPQILSFEKIAEILYQDEEEEFDENEEESENQDSKEEDSELVIKKEEGISKFGLNVKYEYQDCCPVDIVENKLQRIGKLAYSIKYNGKYYKFSSMENMQKFKMNPKKYINLELQVRKVNQENNNLSEKQILFNNTVNFLEFTFGSLITKGMLELSNNRIKYPYLNVKESSLKYLALYLKANNPKNNKYAMEKYKKILKDFIRNSELPWELYHVYENYKKEKDNVLNKKLIRKQLDTVSVKYDKLMEKAKIQNNTRFANFFRISNETNEEEKNE